MDIDYDSLFCFVDDFVKDLKIGIKRRLLPVVLESVINHGKMSLSEIITILIAFHQSGMSCFKYFYLELMKNHRNYISLHVLYYAKMKGIQFPKKLV